jgi:three-Cys-motif partner protein
LLFIEMDGWLMMADSKQLPVFLLRCKVNDVARKNSVKKGAAIMKHDVINYWSEVKLDIVREYAGAYSRILAAQRAPRLYHAYIDAFAGAGIHVSKKTGDFVKGSPTNALLITPPFREYHFIDMDASKVKRLRDLSQERADVRVYEGDCNKILLDEVFPKAQFGDYRRALCLLDPYGLHLRWEVLATAGQMKSVEIFFNFSIMDANMNVLKHDPDEIDPRQIERMNDCWGDDSWRAAAYRKNGNLFGWDEKTNNETIVKAFQKRLKDVAGFSYVPDPMPMRNSKGATVYYLFFASQKPVAAKIVKGIFDKYRNVRG